LSSSVIFIFHDHVSQFSPFIPPPPPPILFLLFAILPVGFWKVLLFWNINDLPQNMIDTKVIPISNKVFPEEWCLLGCYAVWLL
jgi:hypothetical protein